jgi:hypothetical protein
VDSVWLQGVKKQAEELKIPLDSSIRMVSKWFLDKEMKEKK